LHRIYPSVTVGGAMRTKNLRGTLDSEGVEKRSQGRSKYGAKRAKKGAAAPAKGKK